MSPSARPRFALSYALLFSIYAAASPYLPLLLRGLGYRDSAVGLLLGLVEAVGIIGPVVIARATDRHKAYRRALAFSGLAAGLSLVPLAFLGGVGRWGLPATVLSIGLFALGLRSLVPVMDSAAIALLDRAEAAGSSHPGGYGALRAWGTVGYIFLLAVLQVVGLDDAPPGVISLWMAGPGLLFVLSLLALPELDASRFGVAPHAGGTVGAGAAAGLPRARTFDPVFLLGLLLIALSRLAMSPINSFFSLFVTDRLGLHAVGALWALSAAAEIPALVVSGRLIARFGPMGVVSLGSAGVVLRLLIYALFPSLGGAIAGQLLHAVCYGLFHPAAVAFVAARVHPSRRSQGMAVYMAFGIGLPIMLGSSLGGLILESWGFSVLFALFTLPGLVSIGLFAATRSRFSPPRSAT